MDPQEKGPTLYDFLSEAELLHYYDSIKSILKIQKTSQLKYVIEEDLIELGMSKPEQRRLKKFYNRHFPHNYLSKIKKLLGPNKREETPAPAPPFVITCLDDCKIADIPPPEPFVKVPNKHIISTEDLTITKELGTGEFGLVQQGIWTDDEDRKIHVAIKCLCRDRMQSSSLEFLKEAAIMHSIEHPDIVRLYGVVLHPDSLMLVTELAPLRSLLECIKEIVLRPTFEITTLCEYAQQICQGMVYLERKRFIHRDLAARNILVFSKDKVKISDFGLSRALGAGKDYYQTNFNANLKLPIAWCAPECITYLKFTSASDVWAYAVTLWEMFSYGIQPWSALSGNQILNAIDAPNFQRLEQPECCPKDYFTLMWRCWRHEPHLRPKFTEIAAMLPNCRPERVEVIAVPQILEKKRSDILNCRIGDVITVLDKSSTRWRGVLLHGKTGYFNPANVKLYIPPPPGKEKDSNDSKESSTNSQLSSNGFRRNSLAEGTSSIQRRLDRNSVRSKGRLRSDMISAPQGEVKHTSHIGLDGAYFGLDDSYLRDVPFMDPACNSPYQLTTHPSIAPYNKQGDDFDHTPLINPNSPSHNAHIYYPMHSRSSHKEANLHRGGSAMSNRNDSHYAGNSDGTEDESRSILKGKPSSFKFDSFNQIRGSKVKWPGKGTKGIKGANKYKYAEQNACFNNGNAAVEEFEPPHEYQEISETEGPSSFFTNEEQHKGRPPPLPESPKVEKTLDFGQSLLDEMESLFRNLNGGSPHQMQRSPATLSHDHDAVNNCNELAELASRLTSSTLSRKKHSSVKPISAHDQRTLDSAIALANELTARSMNDLDHGDPIKTPNSPSERSKFTFKFPLVGGHSHSNSNANGQEYGKYERRNFSKEAQSVPDLQSTITKESRMAYECLIEQPTPTAKDADERRSDSLLRNIPSAAYLKAIVKSGYNPSRLKLPDVSDVHPPIESMERQPVYVEAIGTVRCTSSDVTDKGKTYIDLFTNMKRQPMNMLPLPPRDRSKPQTEKIRHTRKHPLILDALDIHHQPSTDRKPVSTISINATLPKKPPALQFASIVRDTRALPPKPEFQPPIPKRATYENVDRPLLSDAYDHHSLKFEAQLTKSIQEEQVILLPPAPRGDSNRLLNTNEEPIYARVTIARCLPQTQNEDSTGITKQMEGLHLQYIDYDPADDPAYITIEPNNSDDDDSTDGQAADILKPTSTEHNDPEAGPISRDANIKP